jgi:hypothetical protein
MIHELIVIEDNLIKLKSSNLEYVMSSFQDSFFEKNLTSNFGDLGNNVKEHVQKYQVIFAKIFTRYLYSFNS